MCILSVKCRRSWQSAVPLPGAAAFALKGSYKTVFLPIDKKVIFMPLLT